MFISHLIQTICMRFLKTGIMRYKYVIDPEDCEVDAKTKLRKIHTFCISLT